MSKPILVIMAAGMGSRYGGLKQIEPVGPNGEIILDYSVFDAVRAGFERVIFIIKREMQDTFEARIDQKMKESIEINYAFQELRAVPDFFTIPDQREKPWGTGHAVMSAREYIDGPFAVINADDYYGTEAFALMYTYLNCEDRADNEYAMCTWKLANTLSDHGHVSRGICSLSATGCLQEIVETKEIYKTDFGGKYSTDGGKSWTKLPANTPVSMNFWGVSASFLDELDRRFPVFLRDDVKNDPLKAEFLLPEIIDACIKEGKVNVFAMPVSDRWYGMTYREDKTLIMSALADLTEQGLYPDKLWK
ncbi:MAG TPA: nucleotidyltransferase [Clostridiaceae bacterium]|nr:nucleotidyltransferase [Clostridiaceae bacterium]